MPNYPAIPQPNPNDIRSLAASVQAMKEVLEILLGERGTASKAVVTVGGLPAAVKAVPGLIPTDGTDGSKGAPGRDGVDGEDAWTIPGPSGATGVQGLPGATIIGSDGDDGRDSFVPGPVGTPGVQGLPGIPGRDGDDSDAIQWFPPGSYNPWVVGSGLIYYLGTRIGIGTSSPGRMLHLSLSGQPTFCWSDTRGSAGNQTMGFLYDGGIALTKPAIVIQDLLDAGGFNANLHMFAKDGSVVFSSNTLPTAAGTVAFMGGKMGLGVLNPVMSYEALLNTPGDVPVLGTNAGEGAKFTLGNTVELTFGSANFSPFGVWIQAKIVGTATAFPLLLNPAGGNVGIGTSTPQCSADVNGLVKTAGYTVATLPTASTGLKGAMAYVTDASAPTFLAAVVGGGAVITPVFCNGTAWVCG